MIKLYTFIFFIVSTLFVKANIRNVVLTDTQYALLNLYNISDSFPSTLYSFKSFALQHPELQKIDSINLSTIAKLLFRDNTDSYKSDTHHVICKKLANSIITSEPYKIFLILAQEQGVKDVKMFNANMQDYFYKQIFDFYYYNKVIGYLDKPEYLEVLKPKALIDLLEKQKGADTFLDEIVFITINSKFRLFN
ncbi:MAG: hypothetical protein U0T77_09235 [Chitinophagales bacterium]